MPRVLCSSAALAALVLLLVYAFIRAPIRAPIHPTQTGQAALARGGLEILPGVMTQAGNARRHLLAFRRRLLAGTPCPTYPDGDKCCKDPVCLGITVKVTVLGLQVDACLGVVRLDDVSCACYTTGHYYICKGVELLGACVGDFDTYDYNTQYAGTCDTPVNNDPIITGLDGKQFHFDELGEWNMLSEGSGWQVHTTFSGAQVEAGESVPMEKSWTTSVRVISPTGDKVSCDLAALRPNTTRPTMTATPAGSAPISMTPTNNVVELGDMTAMAVATGYPNEPYLTGCHIVTPKIDILVYQVDGWDQAQKFPDLEGWAAPFTWLNMDVKLLDRLAAPVTGIMGATYPKSALAPQPTDDTVALRAREPGRATPILEAHMEGEPVGLVRQQRRLAGVRDAPLLTAGVRWGAH